MQRCKEKVQRKDAKKRETTTEEKKVPMAERYACERKHIAAKTVNPTYTEKYSLLSVGGKKRKRKKKKVNWISRLHFGFFFFFFFFFFFGIY